MLSSRHKDLLEALVNRIIPADEHAGGWEAGVGDYLAHQFEHDLNRVQPLYALGLMALDAEAQARHGQSFDRLSSEVQDALLAQVEVGQVTSAWPVDPVIFFRMVAEHCAEGYYSDPANGGNKNGVSWAMIGFQVRG